MNNVQLIGRLTKDTELTTTQNGISIVKFSLAVDRKYKDANGDKITDFFNCSAFRGLAENINKYCRKGSKVYLSGELQNRLWQKENGEKQYFTEIAVSECEFLDNKPQGQEIELIPVEDDLPF